MSDRVTLLRKLVAWSLLAGMQLAAATTLAAEEPRPIKTASFRVTAKLASDPAVVQRWYLTEEVMRMELPGQQGEGIVKSDLPLLGATIQNLRLKQGVEIDFLEKRVHLTQLTEEKIRNYQN